MAKLFYALFMLGNLQKPESNKQLNKLLNAMKRILTITLVFALAIMSVNAQNPKGNNKAKARYTEQKVNSKPSKSVRKSAKEYEDEGWIVAPGFLPLEKQLEQSYNMMYERDENGLPTYITGDAQSIGETYDAAKSQAMELAKLSIASMIENEITAIIEHSVANKQLDEAQASSLVETMITSKSAISKRIGRVIPVVECYRVLKNKNKEVRVLVFYNSQTALKTAKEVIREELSRRGDILHEQLDAILGF